MGLGAVACSGSSAAGNGGVIITPIVATSTPIPFVVGSPVGVLTPNGATTPAPNGAGSQLTQFSYPIAGGCLPKGDQLMPNAPRPYREGIHEGVDFYDSDNCTRIARGTPVLAAKPGRIIRADLSYNDMTPAELAKYSANPNTDEALDKFRGRQVWVDHGNGIVTRYCHLSGVAPGIAAGTTVATGQVLGYVGESGTPESVTAPGTENHLHFELRAGDSYLGKGLPAAEVRQLYQTLFSP